VADPTHSIELKLDSKKPDSPRREWSPIHDIKPISLNRPGPDIEILKTNGGWTIVAYLGKIQAKDVALTSEKLFVGVAQSAKIELAVRVFADELSNPVISSLSIGFTLAEQELTYEKLTK